MISITNNKVYSSGLHIGDINLFCCGTDFKIHQYPDALFSILKIKTKSQILYSSIEAILSLKIPNVKFHWNFDCNLIYSEEKLNKYQENLNTLNNENNIHESNNSSSLYN